jgi:hypothetical protein
MNDAAEARPKKKGLPWWGWTLIAVLALVVIVNVANGGGDTATQQPESSETSVTEDSDMPEAEEVAVEEEAEEVPDETTGESNARRSAETYLSFSAFSKSGLIDQLLFEGFSQEEAEYGVEAQDVDWNEQAAKSAKTYLEISSFSRQGLIDQLLFEGFSAEEAEYGVSQNGF